jgi:arginine N-succinyltransferase
MHVIRPIRQEDFEGYAQFAFAARLGMASMPKNRELLQKNIESSLRAFSTNDLALENKFYLFVLEDMTTKEIGGASGIYSQVGVDSPYYYYREEIEYPLPYKNFPIPKEMRTLKAIKITHGPSEICSLYLFPSFRKEGLGRLLSLSRFLFIAAFPSSFQATVIAEMRGFIDKNNHTPFWEHLGRYFLDFDYAEVQHIKDTDKEFIPHILPQYPIYVDLLPKEAQNMIGNVHENTRPALKILEQEGFEITKDYDIFDAGPVIRAEKNSIRMIKSSAKKVITAITTQPLESTKYIISNGKKSFRACYSFLKELDEGVILPVETAEALFLQVGDYVTFAPAFPS